MYGPHLVGVSAALVLDWRRTVGGRLPVLIPYEPPVLCASYAAMEELGVRRVQGLVAVPQVDLAHTRKLSDGCIPDSPNTDAYKELRQSTLVAVFF